MLTEWYDISSLFNICGQCDAPGGLMLLDMTLPDDVLFLDVTIPDGVMLPDVTLPDSVMLLDGVLLPEWAIKNK